MSISFRALSLALLTAALSHPALAQVQVTFHLDPPNKSLTTFFLAGSFNDWSGSDPAYQLRDPDGDGVYEVTAALAPGRHYYRFAVPGSAWLQDPGNPLVSPPDWGSNSIVDVSDPMVTYLLPKDGEMAVRFGAPIRAVFAHSDAHPLDLGSLRVTIDGVPLANPQAYYDASRKTFTYAPPAPLGPGEHTVEVSVASAAGTVTRRSAFRMAPAVRLLTEDMVYRKPEVVVYGEVNDPALRQVRLEVNGSASVVDVVDGHFQMPVTLSEGDTVVRASPPGSTDPAASTEQVLRLEQHLDPHVEITGSVSGRQVTLTVAEPAPTGKPLSFVWTEGPTNPAPLSISGSAGPAVSFSVPAEPGEYYVSATATDAEGRSFTARRYVTSAPGAVTLNSVAGRAAWIDRMVIYEVNLLLFSERRDLTGLRERLDELADLGVNALYLMPLVESESIDGYQPTDYYAIRESYGAEADLRALVEAAHARGMRVILDLVYNHTGDAHPFFRNVRALKGSSPFANYYVWSGTPGASEYAHALSPAMPNLNTTDPEVREYLIKAAEYWVREFDIDGFKADVGWAVQHRSPTFWGEFRRRMKNLKPDFFMMVEAFPPLDVYFDDRFDAAYDHDLRGYGYEDVNALTRVLNGTGSVDELDAVIRRAHPPSGLPYRFAETHDLERIPRLFGVQRSKLAHTLVFTVNGIPNIWAGAEYGEDAPLYQMSQVINRSDPHGLRPYFQRLVDIRRRYIRNDAAVTRLPSTAPSSVYAYATVSDTNVVVTALNFSGERQDLTVDLTQAPGWSAPVAVTDLFTGGMQHVEATLGSAYPIALEPYGATVLYFGGSGFATSLGGGDTRPAPATLFPNYPNPFGAETTIAFELPVPAEVRLAVFDVLGREIAVLVDGEVAAGVHRVPLDGSSLSSGVYVYRLRAGSFESTGRMLRVR